MAIITDAKDRKTVNIGKFKFNLSSSLIPPQVPARIMIAIWNTNPEYFE